MVTPPPRLVVGTYDSSNASDSEFSDFETSREKGTKGRRGWGRGRKVRKMPVSYLGSKFLGSDVESEDDEELVEAFLRRGEKQPGAPPARRRVHLPVPMFEENPGPQPSKADRWREYVSQVSWGKLKRRVKGWAPRTSPGVGEAQQASTRAERDGAPGSASPENAGDGLEPETPPRRWKPKINWASLRRFWRQEAASTAQGTEAAGNQRAEAAGNQGAEAIADQGAEAAADQRVEAAHNQRAEAPAIPEAEALAARGAAGATPGARARKQVKTVRFQTPGRFPWFCKRRRAFWHTPRLPALPRTVPRAGEARSLRVLRAEARAEAEYREQEDPL